MQRLLVVTCVAGSYLWADVGMLSSIAQHCATAIALTAFIA